MHIMVVDHFTVKVSGTKLSCIQFLFAGCLSCVLMFLFEEPHWSSIFAAWLPIAYAGILSCGVAYTFQIIGQRGTDPTITSLILSLELPIAYAGILSCGVAYTFQIIGQRGTDPTITSLILSLESVISVLAGWVLLGQKLSSREMTGCILMFVAIILAQVNPAALKRKRPIC